LAWRAQTGALGVVLKAHSKRVKQIKSDQKPFVREADTEVNLLARKQRRKLKEEG
jgi:hypothetical protein